jgi:methionyl-tRNA synthetase
MAERYYVTTPIYYVNDSPHIGHAYTTIAADVLARFWRAEGREVRFLTGTDEHGIKIVKAAKEKGVEPKQLADTVVVHFQDLWRELNISHDDFIRTTEPRHERRVQALVRALVDRDEIYLGKYKGWYDEGQEEFVTESTARENDYKSPISGRPLVQYEEDNYFFRLGKWVPKLIEFIEANPGFVQPAARRNEVLSKLRMGVEDLCISRSVSKLPWGVPMPNDAEHVVYVWIDALSNYITSLGMPDIDDGRADLSAFWPADVHLIGKDILWFHAVYWPCMLMALDIAPPKCVFAHGWWTSEGKKMSKSLGNFISREAIVELCGEYSIDVFRYYLLRAVTFGQDGDFSRDMLRQRYNGELANGVGNLLSRTVNMIGRYFGGEVPPPGEAEAVDAPVRAAAKTLDAQADERMRKLEFTHYLDAVFDLVTATNQYIDHTEPFKLAKDDTRRGRLGTILYTCAEAVRIVLLHLRPFMPETAARGLRQLGLASPSQALAQAAAWGVLSPGTAVEKGEALFPRKT